MNVLVVRRGVYFERADKIVTNSFLLLFLLFFFFLPNLGELSWRLRSWVYWGWLCQDLGHLVTGIELVIKTLSHILRKSIAN